MNIIFTQAEKVADAYAIPTVSTGNMIREALKNGTEMGLKAKAFIESGALVPDDVVIGIIKERLAKDDCAKGYRGPGRSHHRKNERTSCLPGLRFFVPHRHQAAESRRDLRPLRRRTRPA